MYADYEPSNPRIENDLNNDGILDVRDAKALQLYIAESATPVSYTHLHAVCVLKLSLLKQVTAFYKRND